MNRVQYVEKLAILDEEISLLRKQEAEHKERNRIEFFEPFFYQGLILDYIHEGRMVVTLQGANGIGKTVLGAVVTGSASLGIQPWDGRETRWGRNPVKIRIICSDWEKHAKEVMVPKLKEWFPADSYTTSKNNVGVEAHFDFPDTKSSIEILTDKQDTKDHEGWEGDIVWADEPFGRDKFVANLRGLRKGKGLFLITMTAVREAWILDDIVRNTHPSYASVCEIPQDANPTLTKEFKEVFAASLLDHEKIPRIQGGWLNLVGLVWGGFRKDAYGGKISHIVDDFDIPTDWPVVAMVDFHPATPQAISYYAFDKQGRVFVIAEEWKHLSPEETADHIVRKKQINAWRIQDAFIDPLSKGDTAYIKNRGIEIPDAFTVINDRLWKAGIELHVASKDRDSGILNVEQMLNGVNGLPTLFFFRSLTGGIEKGGHIWEIQRWTYKEGKPKDEDDHFMENLYRMTLTGVRYTPFRKPGWEPDPTQTEFSVFT